MNMDPNKEQLPLSFNSAEKWPGKIHEPLDQGNCAASWAFSTAGAPPGPLSIWPRPFICPAPSSGPALPEKSLKFNLSLSLSPPSAVASDRISIQSMGHMTPQLSPQNLISCDTRNQGGCAGGRVDGAWWFLRRRG